MTQAYSVIISTCLRGLKPQTFAQKRGITWLLMTIILVYMGKKMVMGSQHISSLHDFPWPSFQKKVKDGHGKSANLPLHDFPWPSFQYIGNACYDHNFSKNPTFWQFFGNFLGFEASRACRYNAKIHLNHQNQSSLLKIWNGPRITL